MRVLHVDWVVLTLTISMILKSYPDSRMSPIPQGDVGWKDYQFSRRNGF